MSEADFAALLADTALLRGLDIALIISHLACADDAHHPMNREQLATFKRLCAQLAEGARQPRRLGWADARQGVPFRSRAAWLRALRRTGRGAARAGAPVVRVSARILQVQDVAAGGRVGYSATLSRRLAAPHRHRSPLATPTACSATPALGNEHAAAPSPSAASSRRSSAACRWISSPST